MSAQFHIRLKQDCRQAEWCSSTPVDAPATGIPIQTGDLDAALDAYQKQGKGQALILIVPASDIVFSSINLPIRQQNKLLQAAPYALEDQLAEDIEDLHFAISARHKDGSVTVASVARERMAQWLDPFQERGIQPKSVLPETLCLPESQADGGYQVLIDGPNAIVRTGPYDGFCCATSELDSFLAMAQPLASESAPRMQLFYTPDGQPPEMQLATYDMQASAIDSALSCLLNGGRQINLLQGSFATEPAMDQWLRPAKVSAALLMLWVLTITIQAGIEYGSLSNQVSNLQEANQAQFQQLFPELTRIVDMRAQGEQQLRQLRSEGSGIGLFPLLGATATALQAVSGLSIQELQLRDGRLYLSLSAADIQSLENLRSHFESQSDWILEVQSANAGTDGVQIRAIVGEAT